MKILEFRKRLAAALAACGIVVPFSASGADLQTNLVANPSFESVDPDAQPPGQYDSVRFLDWVDLVEDGANEDGESLDDNFAYAYSQNYSGTPAPPGAGDFHFAGGFSIGAGEVAVTQTIDLSAGDTDALIATGDARYDLRGFFSSYRAQFETSTLRVRFLDGVGNELASDSIGGSDFVAGLPVVNNQVFWGQDATMGVLPTNTTQAVVDIVVDGGAGAYDGYVDLVDFRVGGLPDDVGLKLSVNASGGQAQVQNLTGEPVEINYYEIASAGGAMNSVGWNSLQDQDFEGSGGTSGVGDGWEEAGGGGENVLSESFFQGTTLIADNQTISLGNAFVGGGQQDLVFRYGVADGLLLHGVVDYTAGGGPVDADFNDDGNFDCADVDPLVAEIIAGGDNVNLDLTGDSTINSDDLSQWLADAAAANGFAQPYLGGDANLDGTVNAQDLNAVGISWQGSPSAWCAGDFNADGAVNAQDLNVLGINWQDSIPTAALAETVPEPSGVWLIVVGWFGLITYSKGARS